MNPLLLAAGDDLDTDLTLFQEARHGRGCCPTCGQQLYKKQRRFLFQKKCNKPITNLHVTRGQCVACSSSSSSSSNDTTAAVEINMTNENDDKEIPQVCLDESQLLSSSTTTTTYLGDYNVYGEKHGKGVLRWNNGDTYIGNFSRNQMHGYGEMTWRGDGGHYVGEFVMGQCCGQGTRRYANGNVHVGNFMSGKRHGNGRLYYSNGDLYVGEWVNDEQQGKGCYYYNNGNIFQGKWMESQKHGFGKFQYKSGVLEISLFIENKPIGDGCRWSANRQTAWRMHNGKIKNKVSLFEASDILKRVSNQT